MPAPLLTLRALIQQACGIFAPADNSSRYFTAALHHAQAFRRELIAGNGRELRTAYLDLGTDRTVDLPDDCVEYESVGLLLDGADVIYPLAYNAALSKLPTAGYLPPLDTYWAPEFRIDRENHRLVCSSLVPDTAQLVMEYIGFGACVGKDIAIDPLAHSWGIQFILQGLNAQKKDWQAVAYHKGEALKEKVLYKDRIRNFSLTGAMQVKHEAAAQRWK